MDVTNKFVSTRFASQISLERQGHPDNGKIIIMIKLMKKPAGIILQVEKYKVIKYFNIKSVICQEN